MVDQRKIEEDAEKNDHEWGDVEGEASVSTSIKSLSVERKPHERMHERLYRRRHPGVTNEYLGTTDTGCFHDLLRACSNLLHFSYIINGLALLGYGVVIFFNSNAAGQQRWHTLPTILMIWSSLLLLTGSIGLHGLRSPVCRRYGLIISAYFGIALIIFESALVIYVVIEKQSFLEFLRLREEKFYLTEREINAFGQNLTAFILLFLTFALAEVLRYFALRHLRSEILATDDAKNYAQRRDDARQRGRELRRWKTVARSGDVALSTQDCDDNRTPLLVDDTNSVDDDVDKIEAKELAALGHKGYNTGNDGDSNKFDGNTTTSWWEDTENSSIRDVDSKESQEKSSWLSKVWRSLISKEDSNKDNSSDSRDEQGFASAHGFAPIDDELSMGSFEWANNGHDTSQPQTDIGLGELRTEDNDPDLSWAQDDHN